MITGTTSNGNVSAVITDKFRTAAAEQNLQLQNVAYTLDVRKVNTKI